MITSLNEWNILEGMQNNIQTINHLFFMVPKFTPYMKYSLDTKQHSINQSITQSITSLWCDLWLDHILEVLPDCLLDDLFHQRLGLLHRDQKGLTQVLVELQGPPLHMPLLTPLIDGGLAESEPHPVIIVDLQESNRIKLWVNKDQIQLY